MFDVSYDELAFHPRRLHSTEDPCIRLEYTDDLRGVTAFEDAKPRRALTIRPRLTVRCTIQIPRRARPERLRHRRGVRRSRRLAAVAVGCVRRRIGPSSVRCIEEVAVPSVDVSAVLRVGARVVPPCVGRGARESIENECAPLNVLDLVAVKSLVCHARHFQRGYASGNADRYHGRAQRGRAKYDSRYERGLSTPFLGLHRSTLALSAEARMIEVQWGK
jgi:hypothetical protein